VVIKYAESDPNSFITAKDISMSNKFTAIFISSFIFLFMFGCAEHLHTAKEKTAHEHGNHGSEAAISGLKLNNGVRWEMDGHTRTMSSKMEKTFFNADHSTQSSLNAMGVQLEAQLDVLIAGCTMDGEAHNQLHMFLNDYIPTVNNLSKAKDLESARGEAIKLKGQLEAYKTHFK